MGTPRGKIPKKGSATIQKSANFTECTHTSTQAEQEFVPQNEPSSCPSSSSPSRAPSQHQRSGRGRKTGPWLLFFPQLRPYASDHAYRPRQTLRKACVLASSTCSLPPHRFQNPGQPLNLRNGNAKGIWRRVRLSTASAAQITSKKQSRISRPGRARSSCMALAAIKPAANAFVPSSNVFTLMRAAGHKTGYAASCDVAGHLLLSMKRCFRSFRHDMPRRKNKL